MIQPWYGDHILKSLQNEHKKPYTGSSRFNRGTVVTFPKVYAMNTESPTLAVVYSTDGRVFESLQGRIGPTRGTYVHELKLHVEERE